jgi:hypothetical protein
MRGRRATTLVSASVGDAFHVTCYSRLHWRWFGHVSPSYCTTWPSLVLAHFRFFWVPVVTYVSFLWAHVSCCGWITYHFFIGPCCVFLLVHVAISYSTTRHDTVRPCFEFLFGHVAWRHPSMRQIFNRPCVVLWLFHGSCTGSSTCRIFIWSCGLFWFYYVEYNQLIIEVIWDRHYCTNWLHNNLAWQSNNHN